MPDPMYAASDWMSAYDRLRQQGMAQPEGTQLRAGGMPDWWWQEQQYRERRTPGFIQQPQDAAAIPFGDVADPVSQLAFLLSPHLLAGMKAVGAQAAQPGYSRSIGGFRLGERGNLGPPPVGPRGELLPESVVRGEQGELQRLYHGTDRVYPDFEMSKTGSGAGGDLYGPGIYMTDNPGMAKDYATLGWPREAQEALRSLEVARDMRAYHEAQAASARTPAEAMESLGIAEQIKPLEAQQSARLQELTQYMPSMFKDPANIRPVYADLKNPFPIDKPIPEDMAKMLWEYVAEPGESFRNAFGGAYQNAGKKWKLSGDDFYQILEKRVFGGDKAKVNALLQEAGYDGITHIGSGGGAPHRVYIAFSPNEVYPSFNVDALRPTGGAR